MSEIDFEALRNSIIDNLDERLINRYDFDVILKSAKLVWDDTAIQVTANDFTMIFDKISYEILQYIGFDIE